MTRNKKIVVFVVVLALIAFSGVAINYFNTSEGGKTVPYQSDSDSQNTAVTPEPPRNQSSKSIPSQKTLSGGTHTFQTFNNCGPATLSMALSYFAIFESQQAIGQDLRPYQVPNGDNDDKSTTLDELAGKAEEFGLLAYHRPNGSTDLLKQFIALNIPVITKTWTKPDDDIGHYRLVKGYTTTSLIQDDSLQGKDLSYTFNDFNVLWKKFNYEYLVLVPKSQKEAIEAILGEDLDPQVAWTKAVNLSRQQLASNPEDIYARFNLSVALYNTGDYAGSVAEFEKVENQLPFRTLWYQMEPVQAYFELGNYARVFQITDEVLNNHNLAYSEMYLLRGEIYKKQGKMTEARQEFEKAVKYNINLNAAHEALASLN